MKQLHISISKFRFFFLVLPVQLFLCCTDITYNKIMNRIEVSPQIKILIKNTQKESQLVWFSKDSSTLHYFFGTRPGAISIIHAIQDDSYPVTSYPVFVSPYLNFIRVLGTNDSLIVIINDSTAIKDIHISDFSALPFINKKELSDIKALGYNESLIILNGTYH